MIYAVQNTSSSARVLYNTTGQEITIPPGATRNVEIDDGTFTQLAMRGDILVQRAPQPPPAPIEKGRPLNITGHFGIGDNLHQRAVMRELMKTHDVWLHTCHAELYHDLIAQGLKLVLRPTHLHAQAKTIARERHLFKFPPPPANAASMNIGYPKVLIDKYGSILETMFGCVGLMMPEKPDFTLPIKPEWKESIRDKYLNGRWDMGGRPLLIHRPIVVRREWDGRSRNPDPPVFDELFRSIRDRFFVVSLADLAPEREWIDGPRQHVDIELHSGELSFPEMAALFAEADLVFCNAGFAPVLAQAVGTDVIVVYGGRESYRTTQRVGAHLARTLPIDPINPCDCHSAHHQCDKRIDLTKALAAVKTFVAEPQRDTLLFGTFYIDSPDRDHLTDLWKQLHVTLNDRGCDFLAVDTDAQPPIKKFVDWVPYDGKRHHKMYFCFLDNIGHLSRARTTQGRDGWGRAFCKGLEIACELGYRYAVHIEGDSLFRLNVADVTKWMAREGALCASTDVTGMKNPILDKQWIETGLMFFSTDYIKRSNFIARYDWPRRQVSPTPERWIRLWILQQTLTGNQLRIMPWRAFRADKQQINKDNIATLDLDWVTHQHDSAQQGVYEKFVEMALVRREEMPAGDNSQTAVVVPQSKEAVPAVEGQATGIVVPPQSASRETGCGIPQAEPSLPCLTLPCPTVPHRAPPHPTEPGHAAPPLLRINLGCGNNRLPGWQNHDADVDIGKVLPWPDNSASHVFTEHVVEHVPYKRAISFMQEALRILAPGGVLRIVVPSLELIAACEEEDYFRFTARWQNVGATKRGAMHAIIYAHGHETVWNAQMLRDTLFFSGFDDVQHCQVGQSADPALRGVEGHGKVIGDKFNLIESICCEARKAGRLLEPVVVPPPDPQAVVAVIIGGAMCWQQDLDEARKLLNGHAVRYYYINDQIKTFPEPGVAVTLHPDKLTGAERWLEKRSKNGLPVPEQVWAHRKHPAVTHDTASTEWQGSSGLFAIQVAHREGHRKVIACGVPMTVEGCHFERGQKWQGAIAFRSGWMRCKDELKPWFRSMSGWTAQMWGTPDDNWLRS